MGFEVSKDSWDPQCLLMLCLEVIDQDKSSQLLFLSWGGGTPVRDGLDQVILWACVLGIVFIALTEAGRPRPKAGCDWVWVLDCVEGNKS